MAMRLYQINRITDCLRSAGGRESQQKDADSDSARASVRGRASGKCKGRISWRDGQLFSRERDCRADTRPATSSSKFHFAEPHFCPTSYLVRFLQSFPVTASRLPGPRYSVPRLKSPLRKTVDHHLAGLPSIAHLTHQRSLQNVR